jgi:hypothetical protein
MKLILPKIKFFPWGIALVALIAFAFGYGYIQQLPPQLFLIIVRSQKRLTILPILA